MIVAEKKWTQKPYKPDRSKNSKLVNFSKTRDTIKVIMTKEEMFLIESLLSSMNPGNAEMVLETYSFRIANIRKSLLAGIRKALRLRYQEENEKR